MKNIINILLFLCIATPCFAQINQTKEIKTFQKFGDYTVHYNVFNSKNIPADVAKLYKLNRGKDIAYINISLTKTEKGKTSLGLPAKVSIQAINLMQQTKVVAAQEIKEPEATYYLASFRHNNEEDFRFEVRVVPEGEMQPLLVSFTRRLFTEN